jgi:hypothetical protein
LVNDKHIIMQIMQSWINLFKLWDKLTFSRKECLILWLLLCPSKEIFLAKSVAKWSNSIRFIHNLSKVSIIVCFKLWEKINCGTEALTLLTEYLGQNVPSLASYSVNVYIYTRNTCMQ